MAKKKRDVEVENIPEEISPIEAKRNALIEGLSGLLLTKSQLKKGGTGVRSRSLRESGYQADINEINELGTQLGLPKIGLGEVRRN
jgi:hypothetical protein